MKHVTSWGLIFGVALLIVSGTSVWAADAVRSKAKVYLAGSGSPEHLTMLLDDLAEYLRSKNVPARVLSGTAKSRDVALDDVAAKGGQTLLFLSADIGEKMGRSTLTIKCMDLEGTAIWSETIGAALFNMSPSGDARDILKKSRKMLSGKIGKPGLPTQ
jgi:hypothetical protein